LETLPGIGPYTAAAIMSFAYGDEHLAWDTNLSRVIGRFFFGGKQLVGNKNFWEERFRTSRKTLNAALMDFGSALCVSRPKCEACSLSARCVYYREKGKQEKRIKNPCPSGRRGESGIKKGKEKNTWRDAEAHVFLHENHKKYFSADKKVFKPFILPSGCSTRAGIKRYFQDKYDLSLSVRPPYKKMLIKGTPTLLVNAQILLGSPLFSVFSKEDQERYNEGLGDNI
jgi:A/G-specific adenine glycosylase